MNRSYGAVARCVSVSALALLLALAPSTWRLAVAAAVLMKLSAVPLPAAMESALLHPVEQHDLSLRTSGAEVRARRYQPQDAAAGKAPKVLLLHGVHALGIDEPRLSGLARALASAGLDVLTPELTRLAHYQVVPEVVSDIDQLARAWATETGSRAVGVIGISFAGGLALMAAAAQGGTTPIAFVASVGAHHDLTRVCDFYAGRDPRGPGGEPARVAPHPYGSRVFLRQALPALVSASDYPLALQALDTYLHDRHKEARRMAEGLSPEGREVARILFDQHNSEILTRWLLTAAKQERQQLLAASPRDHLSGLQVPVLLLHGTGDPIVPSIETQYLAREVPNGLLREMLITDLLRHAELTQLPAAKEIYRFARFIQRLLGVARFKITITATITWSLTATITITITATTSGGASRRLRSQNSRLDERSRCDRPRCPLYPHARATPARMTTLRTAHVCAVLLAVFVCLASACAPAEGARPRGLGRVQQHGALRWGADIQGGEPYVFEDPTRAGKLVGFEVEIADALARELGVRAEFVQNDWSTLVPSLERGTFDIILNGLEPTPARRERIALSRPYYVFQEVLTAREGETRVRDLASLRALRVGTLANTLAWDMLGASEAERVPYEGVEEPYLDLLHGRIDAVVLDDVVADRYAHKPGLRNVAQVGSGEYVVGVQRGEPDLLNAVDRALGTLERSGELQAILRRWQLTGPTGPDSGRPAVGQATAADRGAAPPAAVRGGDDSPQHASFELGSHQLVLFLRGAWVTIAISMVAMLVAVVLGMLLALARLPSPYALRRVLSVAATVYVEVFRGTPVLLQLYVLYYGLASVISLDAFTAAALGLGLNYAAYEAEIYRAGIQAVPHGEVEAARAMGMSGALTLRRVVLPHAVRFSLPGVANDFISLLKDSSLVSVITVVELTKRMTIAAVDGRSWLLPGLLCAALYLVMSYPLSLLARHFEQHLGGHKP